MIKDLVINKKKKINMKNQNIFYFVNELTRH